MDHQYSFEKLRVWQDAREFVSFIYKITNTFPQEEKFGLTNQIRRAGVSIAANLAEGSSRVSSKDQAHFTHISYSSLMEVLSHIYIASDLGFIEDEPFKEIKKKIFILSRQLAALRKSQLS